MRSTIAGIITLLVVIGAGIFLFRWWRSRSQTAGLPVPSPIASAAVIATPPAAIATHLESQIPDGVTKSFSPVGSASGSAVLRYEESLNDFVGTVMVSEDYADAPLGVWVLTNGTPKYLGQVSDGKVGLFYDIRLSKQFRGSTMVIASKGKTTTLPDTRFFELSL